MRLRQIRRLLWILVPIALLVAAAVYLAEGRHSPPPQSFGGPVRSRFGGPFTLIGADGRPFSSQRLAGKPYAIYFGFTRCGDICPTTLSRLVKLRREAASDEAVRILFVTIDPSHDGPREVGQYATLFNAPITGLTGSPAQIDAVKGAYGIYAQSVPNAPMGKEMEHTATVLLFDRDGNFAGTISPDEPDADALAQIRALVEGTAATAEKRAP